LIEINSFSRENEGVQMADIKKALASMLRGPTIAERVAGEFIVCLEEHHQEPSTYVERLAVAALKETGTQPLHRLVERVAAELYREELRHGATTLDIGLFGSRLFVPDVISELDARNGSLWRIEKLKEVSSGHLSYR
jgi:hypothetical protein